jgi:hypothetical protein
MLWLGAGAATFIITAGLFWYCLPRRGKKYRFVGTELESYSRCILRWICALLFDGPVRRAGPYRSRATVGK